MKNIFKIVQYSLLSFVNAWKMEGMRAIGPSIRAKKALLRMTEGSEAGRVGEKKFRGLCNKE
jgi:hypothetical protein